MGRLPALADGGGRGRAIAKHGQLKHQAISREIPTRSHLRPIGFVVQNVTHMRQLPHTEKSKSGRRTFGSRPAWPPPTSHTERPRPSSTGRSPPSPARAPRPPHHLPTGSLPYRPALLLPQLTRSAGGARWIGSARAAHAAQWPDVRSRRLARQWHHANRGTAELIECVERSGRGRSWGCLACC